MRLKFLGLGIVIIFVGLLLVSLSRSTVTIKNENRQIVKEGDKDSFEVTDVSLSAGDKFAVMYSGGGHLVSPDEVIVNIFDPLGNLTTFSYMATFRNGIIANYTGAYKMQVGAPGLIDPSSPLLVRVEKITETTRTEQPNSNMLPVGMSTIVIGAGISIWGTVSSKEKRMRGKVKKPRK